MSNQHLRKMSNELDSLTLDNDNDYDHDTDDDSNSSSSYYSNNHIDAPMASNLPPINFNDGKAPKQSMTAATKQMIGPYVIGEIMGKGGSASVYKGLNTVSGDFVAVKCFQKSKISREQLSSIMVELDLLQKLSHDNIVRILGKDENDTTIYLIMEYMENGSLASIMNQFGTFPESLICTYIEQVLQGLVYLHSENVIHRDIKAANILINKIGDAKLADFNVAAQLNDSDKRYSVVGTPYWMAPEVIDISGHCQVSDTWSLGCTIIELLTGSPPYYNHNPMAAMFRIVQNDRPPFPKNISEELNDFLGRCFVKSVEERASASELLHHRWITKYRSNQRGSFINHRASSNIMDHISKTLSAFNNTTKDRSISCGSSGSPGSASILESINEHHLDSNDTSTDEKSNTISFRPSSLPSSPPTQRDSVELKKQIIQNTMLQERIKELEKELSVANEERMENERKSREILLSSMHYIYIVDSSGNIGVNPTVKISDDVANLRAVMRDQIETEYFHTFPDRNMVPRFIERRLTRDTLIHLPKKALETQKKREKEEKKKAEKREKEKLEKEKKDKKKMGSVSSPVLSPEVTSHSPSKTQKRSQSKGQLLTHELVKELSQQNFKLNSVPSNVKTH
ncbi:hypothetical protein SAMD00019534_121070 [Acytostelium subglobosum LB1]|uniref:hypothetical protein n=1 Tax=Acytostelium subglobosum LB1 TaxID=1410327 RepID=UPI000644F9DD|nr:hypothetical protein SAMD00019534_121070 [Acytostelium subglobosum LB1]GAM28931.1 hypothetical protein SAMD00019534_121070 [Acytostelium subglobosum LB1]|eukprot:XP_012748116.1 hypothetical protein SAMD00019534_121070 [Acytostelium subglobosum LB1]